MHNYRGHANTLIARTTDFLFFYNIDNNTLSYYTEITESTKKNWYVRDSLDVLERWPHCDRREFAAQLQRLKIHACARYSAVMKDSDDA